MKPMFKRQLPQWLQVVIIILFMVLVMISVNLLVKKTPDLEVALLKTLLDLMKSTATAYIVSLGNK